MNRLLVVFVVAVLVAAAAWFIVQQNGSAPSPAGTSYTGDLSTTAPTPTPTPPHTPTPTAAPTLGTVEEFVVTGSNFSFNPKELRVKENDRVRITLKNSDGRHDFRLDEFEAATNVIQSGEEQTIEFVAFKKGSFEYYCSVGNHRAMGMVGSFIVE